LASASATIWPSGAIRSVSAARSSGTSATKVPPSLLEFELLGSQPGEHVPHGRTERSSGARVGRLFDE
jgi:hypothetical protein